MEEDREIQELRACILSDIMELSEDEKQSLLAWIKEMKLKREAAQ